MNTLFYDYVIVGSGPSGLSLAYYLGSVGKKCVIIDKNSSTGGAHRVTRVNGLFTEHSPRIYSSSYVNTINLLNSMKSDWNNIFTKYIFSMSDIGGKSINSFKTKEILHLGLSFLISIFKSDYGKNISMDIYMENNNFSENTKDYINRLCRLTDGAGSDRYTLYEFLQLFNQQALYKIYQPKLPNDVGLFKIINEALLNTGNVDIFLETEVVDIMDINTDLSSEKNIITNITIIKEGIKEKVYGKNFILAIPPEPLVKLSKNIFGNLNEWAIKNSYINDIPVIFHWDKKLNLKKVWGFPSTSWGLAFIVLSDYMEFNDPRSLTVISTCITMLDKPSKTINKTPNECNEEELKEEVFRQLLESFPDLLLPTYSLFHPGVKKTKKGWINGNDSAYVATYYNEPIPFNSKIYNNIWNCGTQNDKSYYAFTSFESAVSNALFLSHILEPSTKRLFPFKKLLSLTDIIKVLFLIFIFIFIFIFLYSQKINK